MKYLSEALKICPPYTVVYNMVLNKFEVDPA